MTTYMILNRAQRDEAVAWESEEGALLDPRRLNNQTEWILHPNLLTNPEYASAYYLLSSLPQREVSPNEYE